MAKETDKSTSTQVADKIINVEHIENANFGFVPGSKPFNHVLTKNLMKACRAFDPGIDSFLNDLPEDSKDNWETEKVFLNKAKGLLEGAYVWIIGWQLRRLFAIGNRPQTAELVSDYLTQIFKTFRLTLQLVDYALVTTLWDAIKQNDLNLNKDAGDIALLFQSNIALRSEEYLKIFQQLMELYQSHGLSFPFGELADSPVLKNNDGFSESCKNMIQLIEETGEINITPDHCYRAESLLSDFLSSFSFLADYQLVSMIKIEYEWQRNREPRYIRDFNILGKNRNPSKLLKYGSEPFNSYAVFLRSNKARIDLFPFALDLNALTAEEGSRICFFEHRIKNTGLSYFVLDDEAEHKIDYRGIRKGTEDDIILKENQQLDLRLDTVILQFLDAQNTVLGTKEKFTPVSEEPSAFDNL